MANLDSRTEPGRQRWKIGGVLLGMGFGGFFDGIVLHQVLQWHHVVSEVYEPDTLRNLKLNTLADGLFHVGTYLLSLVGLFFLWNGTRGTHVPWSTRAFVGTLLFGFGVFNVVEGLVNHQLLGVHHVREGPGRLAFDLGFLAWGALMLLVGLAWMWRDDERS